MHLKNSQNFQRKIRIFGSENLSEFYCFFKYTRTCGIYANDDCQKNNAMSCNIQRMVYLSGFLVLACWGFFRQNGRQPDWCLRCCRDTVLVRTKVKSYTFHFRSVKPMTANVSICSACVFSACFAACFCAIVCSK